MSLENEWDLDLVDSDAGKSPRNSFLDNEDEYEVTPNFTLPPPHSSNLKQLHPNFSHLINNLTSQSMHSS